MKWRRRRSHGSAVTVLSLWPRVMAHPVPAWSRSGSPAQLSWYDPAGRTAPHTSLISIQRCWCDSRRSRQWSCRGGVTAWRSTRLGGAPSLTWRLHFHGTGVDRGSSRHTAVTVARHRCPPTALQAVTSCPWVCGSSTRWMAARSMAAAAARLQVRWRQARTASSYTAPTQPALARSARVRGRLGRCCRPSRRSRCGTGLTVHRACVRLRRAGERERRRGLPNAFFRRAGLDDGGGSTNQCGANDASRSVGVLRRRSRAT